MMKEELSKLGFKTSTWVTGDLTVACQQLNDSIFFFSVGTRTDTVSSPRRTLPRS